MKRLPRARLLRLAACVLLLCAESGRADFSAADKGTTSAGFLKLGVGARAAGMGEAYSAVGDEASVLYWNPAAMTQIPSGFASTTFMHAPYIGSSFFDYGAFAKNLGSIGAFGAGIQYLSYGQTTQTDPTTGTDIGAFTPNDLAFSLGYAHSVGHASLGVTGKFIRSQILDSAETGAADIGLLSPAYCQDKLKFAFVASNLGGKLKFDQEANRLPFALRLGSAYKINPRWVSGLDLAFPIDNDPYFAWGTEYRWPLGNTWNLAGRAGFNSLTVKDVGGFTGASFGFGFDFKSFAVDYAFLPMGDLGFTHRISISFMFQPRPVPLKHTSSRFELEDHDILQDLEENPTLRDKMQ